MSFFLSDYLKKLWLSNNQLYNDLKPRERIVKIVENHICPSIEDLKFKFTKSDILLKRKYDNFIQKIWFRTSIKNFKNEVVNFDIYLSVENKDYVDFCKKINYYPCFSEPIGTNENSYILSSAYYLPEWENKFLDKNSWYQLHLENNIQISESIAKNIRNCSQTFLDKNSNYHDSLNYRASAFFSSKKMLPILIPDILVLSHLTNNKEIYSRTMNIYDEWKNTEDGKQRTSKGSQLFTIIDNVRKVL